VFSPWLPLNLGKHIIVSVRYLTKISFFSQEFRGQAATICPNEYFAHTDKPAADTSPAAFLKLKFLS
jgi:hypothetical protein